MYRLSILAHSVRHFFIPLLLILALATPLTAANIPESGKLTPEQGMMLLERYADGGLTLLDVRTRREYEEAHAPGALNIPVAELAARADEVPDGPVLIICRSGRRAESASGILRSLGRSEKDLWYLSGYTDYRSGTPLFHN